MDIEKLKREFFERGGKVKKLPANTYSDSKVKFTMQHFGPGRYPKPLTTKGSGVACANLIYSNNPEG